jgi:hypothetical protein
MAKGYVLIKTYSDLSGDFSTNIVFSESKDKLKRYQKKIMNVKPVIEEEDWYELLDSLEAYFLKNGYNEEYMNMTQAELITELLPKVKYSKEDLSIAEEYYCDDEDKPVYSIQEIEII